MTLSSEDFVIKYVIIVTLFGAQDDLVKCQYKFIVYYPVKNYYIIMEGMNIILNENKKDSREFVDYKRSVLGYYEIVKSFKCEICLGIVIKADILRKYWK